MTGSKLGDMVMVQVIPAYMTPRVLRKRRVDGAYVQRPTNSARIKLCDSIICACTNAKHLKLGDNATERYISFNRDVSPPQTRLVKHVPPITPTQS